SARAALGKRPEEILQLAARECRLEPFRTRIDTAETWLLSRVSVVPKDVSHQLGTGIAASESCITALYIALRFLDVNFEDMVRFVCDCGGDTDTIAAMAGAIWGASNGSANLPAHHLAKLEQHARIVRTALNLQSDR